MDERAEPLPSSSSTLPAAPAPVFVPPPLHENEVARMSEEQRVAYAIALSLGSVQPRNQPPPPQQPLPQPQPLPPLPPLPQTMWQPLPLLQLPRP
eukprot:5003203-Prymnesium_polylepis.1